VTSVIDVSVVVVLHDSGEVVERALESAHAAAQGVCCEWLLVDCGSTDGAAAALRERWPDFGLCTLANLGYGQGANVGLAAARGRYVLLLNPDTTWLDGSIRTLVDRLDALPDVAAAGVLQRDDRGSLVASIMRDPSVRRQLGEALLLHRLPGLGRLREPVTPPHRYGAEHAVDWLVGAVLLVRRAAFEQIGGFDPRFFMYSEETDWCLRARRSGWRILHLPIAAVRHDGGGVPGDPAIARHLAASKIAFAGAHFGSARRTAFRAALVTGYALRAAAFGLAALRTRRLAPRARREIACLAASLRPRRGRRREGVRHPPLQRPAKRATERRQDLR
jgi:GT2 family glycosyltransferase